MAVRDLEVAGDPLEVIEFVAERGEMNTERVDGAELHVSVKSDWRDIAVWFAWREDAKIVQMGAPLELKVPALRMDEICRLLALINERVWLGHFDLWSEDKAIVYRNSAVLPAMSDLDEGQAETLLAGVRDAFNRFFPAFNYVLWGGKTPEEAIEACLYDVAGSA